jgi:uncharacterized protein
MKIVALWILRLYKRWISPSLPPSCRYVPTCSEYAMEAVERYGTVRGGLKAALRILRCHPFVKGGYDPVVKNPARVQAPTNELGLIQRQETLFHL